MKIIKAFIEMARICLLPYRLLSKIVTETLYRVASCVLIPRDFDRVLYLILNPDVTLADMDAIEHFVRVGRKESRPYARGGPVPLPPSDQKLIAITGSPVISRSLKRIAVFAHYNSSHEVDHYVVAALRKYKEVFDRVTFVSASPVKEPFLQNIRESVEDTIVRENVGYDFMSWRLGWELNRKYDLDEVTFINDSVYGPFFDMHKLLSEKSRNDCDLWGVSVSREIWPHVQSYFMVFKSSLIKSGLCERYWSAVDVIQEKDLLVRHHEVGLSAFVQKAAFRVGGLVDLHPISNEVRNRVLADNNIRGTSTFAANEILYKENPNPMQLFWKEAIRLGAPFVKAEILKSNPMGVCQRSVIEALDKEGYLIDLVLPNIRRSISKDKYEDLFKKVNMREASFVELSRMSPQALPQSSVDHAAPTAHGKR